MAELVCPIYDVASLLPHSGDMILLDCVTEYAEDYLTAEMTVRENNILIKNYKADGIKYPLLQKNSSKQNILLLIL